MSELEICSDPTGSGPRNGPGNGPLKRRRPQVLGGGVRLKEHDAFITPAFVIQLDSDSDPPSRAIGRVKHVVSGESAHFHSLAELCAFLARYREHNGPLNRIDETER